MRCSPQSPQELAAALAVSAATGSTIALQGNRSKRLMAGPDVPADSTISTTALRRVLQYEPHDLTISVEAGLPWRELVSVLAGNRQMVPLDPPSSENATVGGVLAANISGPRRRLYGTARDLVIGMQFATLEGKLIQSGGMVVKNVAGLDMAKLMIGSFGTLAAIAVANFKLVPMPEVERSFLVPFASLPEALAARDQILRGVLQPAAIDLLNPAAASTLGNAAWILALRVGGNARAIERYEHEVTPLAGAKAFEDAAHASLWQHIQEFTPRFLRTHPDGVVVRASCTLKVLEAVMASFSGPAVARAGTGVCYGYFEQSAAAAGWMADALRRGWKAVVEFAPEERKPALDLWPSPGGDFELMRRIKNLFDPANLLNRGRLFNRI